MLARIFCIGPYVVAAHIATGFAVIWALASILMILTICHPVQRFWNIFGPGQCGDIVTAFIIFGALDVALDLVILLLPVPMLWRLQIPLANKIGVACIFAMGIL